VPEISRFFGIVIAMFDGDHLPPHFHARDGEHRAIIEIESGTVLTGRVPRSPSGSGSVCRVPRPSGAAHGVLAERRARISTPIFSTPWSPATRSGCRPGG
jgi:hypothetical protein